MAIEVGQNVVVRGKAIGRVEAVTADAIVVVELGLHPGEDSRFEVPRGSEALRPVVDAAEAAQLRALVGIYRHPEPAYPERQYADMLEKVACAELGLALGKSVKQIRAQLRSQGKGAPMPASVALPDRAREVAATDVPPLDDYQPLAAHARGRRRPRRRGVRARGRRQSTLHRDIDRRRRAISGRRVPARGSGGVRARHPGSSRRGMTVDAALAIV